MAFVEKIQRSNHSQGVATILAIGTANPPTIFHQKDYPDFYFRVTNSDRMVELKDKFKRICERSGVNKRHLHLTEDLLKANPNIGSYKAPSLDTRQDMLVPEVPKLAKEASIKAIKEWGQPISTITHLVFCTSSCTNMPGADYHLTQLLGLNPTVNRHMMYHHGCYAGGTALRVAKDLAENTAGARVLAVCSEIMAMCFHGPSEDDMDVLIGQAIFGDGAAAMIVGADPIVGVERPLFRIASAGQMIIPDSDWAVVSNLREMGMQFTLSREIPRLVGANVKGCLIRAFGEMDWDSLFYVIHPGWKAILAELEKQLGLKEGKLSASWDVLGEYGNMSSSTVLFALDRLRKKSLEEGKATTGEGLEWGVLLGLGPGLTVETVVLQSVPLSSSL